jgi:hypothetical protein
MTQQEEAAQKAPATAAEKSPAKVSDPFWGICLGMFICLGGGSMWAVSYFGTRAPSTPGNHVPAVFSWRTEPHRSLMDIDMPEVLIGFKTGGRVYLDVSGFCEQPGFRDRAEIDGRTAHEPADPRKFLVETPDITLPKSLDQRIFSLVSTGAAPEVSVFDSPYQWLNGSRGPVQGACMLLGKKTATGAPQALDPFAAEPVVALTDTDAAADLRLEAQAKPINVTKDNRGASIRKYPWLLRWLREFSSNASRQCGTDEFLPLTQLMPVQSSLLLSSRQNTHWVVASGCAGQNDWSLVITNEDETVSFVRLGRLRSPDDYKPNQVWVIDTDNNGTPEFLVRAQYAQGWRYVLLRLNPDDSTGYHLTEIAKTALVAF